MKTSDAGLSVAFSVLQEKRKNSSMNNSNKSWFTCVRNFFLYYLITFFTLVNCGLTLGQQPSATENGIVYFVLLDDSLSMNKPPTDPTTISWLPKITEVKRQMSTFIASLPNGTEAHFFAFAQELTRGPTVVIKTQENRQELKEFVNGLKAEGTATRLWRSLAEVLKEAATLLERNPNVRVRVLAYTDGEDNESPVPTQPATVLSKYGKLLRQTNVQLTYITIGFELQAEQRRDLESGGVQVRTALAPEDVIPLQADFQLLPTVVSVGERVTVVDDSIGFVHDRIVSWGDGSGPSRARSPNHVYTKAGEYEVHLVVTSTTGKESTTTRKIRVVPPPAPKAMFVAPERVEWNSQVTLVDRSTGDVETRKWFLDDQEVSGDQLLSLKLAEPGTRIVRLVVQGKGGVASVTSKIEVSPPTAPRAEIAGPKSIALGETLTLFDRSTGLIDRAAWYVDDQFITATRDFSWKSTKSGEHVIVYKVAGPGGKSQAEHHVQVRGPERPTADFAIPTTLRVDQPLHLVDRSQGLIQELSWTINDTVISQERDASFQFTTPGEHAITLTIRGPGGTDSVTKTISVDPLARPTASFVIGTPQPLLDTATRITDTSVGEIDEAIWFLPGRKSPLVVNYRQGGSRSIDYTFTELGKQEVQLKVLGPGGESEVLQTFDVQTDRTPPQPNIAVDVVHTERDRRVIRFRNRSKGTVLETVFDFGDGSRLTSDTTMEDVLHEYKPGTYLAKVRVQGAREFAPAVVDISIDVPKPWPTWIPHLLWMLPTGLIAALASFYGIVFYSRRLREQRLSRLVGTLNYNLKDARLASYHSVLLDGTSNCQSVTLDDSSVAVVEAYHNPESHAVEHTIELFTHEVSETGRVSIAANEPTVVGLYEFKLVQVL